MFDERLAQRAAENLKKIRGKKPLVHSITNYVVMNYTANALLACGAAAVMAHGDEEVEEVVSLADALVLNLGTLTRSRVEAMIKAGKRANLRKIPVILDPVGAGATVLRGMMGSSRSFPSGSSEEMHPRFFQSALKDQEAEASNPCTPWMRRWLLA